MTLVYLDANVLVPSYTRTLLVMSAPLSDFAVAWSLHAEAKPNATKRPERSRSRHCGAGSAGTRSSRNVLGRLAKARTRQPCTAHRVETGERLPLLAPTHEDGLRRLSTPRQHDALRG